MKDSNELDNSTCYLLMFLFFVYLVLLGCFIYNDFINPNSNRCENEIIKNSKDYVEFEKCKKIDNKYYCYNK